MRKLLFLAALGAVCVSANAAVIQVPTRAALAANDSIDWGQFGPEGTDVGAAALGTTANGVNFLVSSGDMLRLDQGSGWNGAFNNGDKLIWNQNQGDITIQFATTEGAVGFDTHSDFYGPYTATMSAYDGLGMLLGTFSVGGNAQPAPGTASFLGIRSDKMDIAKVVISNLDQFGGNDFAINYVSLGNCAAVPEPTTMAALGLGALGILKRRKKA